MSWLIDDFPYCTHHVFIAHCQENRETLAIPIYRALQALDVAAWLDRYDYPEAALDEFQSLRDAILKCRFVVYLVTEESLDQGRGWQAIERAYGELLQRNLAFESPFLPVELPLFYVQRSHPTLTRSCWSSLIANDVARFYPTDHELEISVMKDWAVREIVAFRNKQESFGTAIVPALLQDPRVRDLIKIRRGFEERITFAHP